MGCTAPAQLLQLEGSVCCPYLDLLVTALPPPPEARPRDPGSGTGAGGGAERVADTCGRPPTGTPDSGLGTPAQAWDPRDPPAQSHFPGPSQAAGGSRHRPTSRFPTAPLGTRRQRDLAPSSWWCCPDWKQDTKTGREADRTGGLGRTWPGEGTLARLTLTEEVAPATVTQGQWERAAEGAEPQRPYPDCMLPGLPRTLPEGSGLLPSLTHRAERSPTPPRELGMLGPAGQPLQPGAPESRCAEVRGRGLVPPGPRLPGWTKAVRPRAPVA